MINIRVRGEDAEDSLVLEHFIVHAETIGRILQTCLGGVLRGRIACMALRIDDLRFADFDEGHVWCVRSIMFWMIRSLILRWRYGPFVKGGRALLRGLIVDVLAL